MRLILFTSITILILIIWKLDIFTYPIKEVTISSSNSRYNQDDVYEYLDSIYGKNLLTLDIDKIKFMIIKDKWIRDAEISKIFPDEIKIIIIEHEPLAIYNDLLMTINGNLIDYSKIDNIPIIRDNTNDQDVSYQILKKVSQKLIKIDLEIEKIEIFHSLINIKTQEAILISDREKIYENIDRLIRSYNKLKDLYDKDIYSIDMRYSNGFAIK